MPSTVMSASSSPNEDHTCKHMACTIAALVSEGDGNWINVDTLNHFYRTLAHPNQFLHHHLCPAKNVVNVAQFLRLMIPEDKCVDLHAKYRAVQAMVTMMDMITPGTLVFETSLATMLVAFARIQKAGREFHADKVMSGMQVEKTLVAEPGRTSVCRLEPTARKRHNSSRNKARGRKPMAQQKRPKDISKVMNWRRAEQQ